MQRDSSGISDTVGAVILIAIVTTGIAVISSHMISQAEYGAIPAVDLDFSVNDSNFLKLFNEGGDAILRDQTTIYVDGIDVTSDLVNEAGGPWSSLAAGNSIGMELPEGEDADSLIVVHHFEGGGSQVITTLGDTIIPPEPTTATPTPTATTASPTPTETATPGAVPVADFTADPTSGVAPLTVQFTDTSTGTPTSWSWSFGDGDTSTAQNPSHTYADAGTYTVSLTATNAYGSDTETKTDYITVTEAPLPVTDTLLNAIKPSSLQSGGYLQVRVGGQWSSVTIDGTVYDVDVGDTVRLTIGSDGTGSIWADSGGLSTFSFDDVTLKVNGAVVDSGTVTGIWINDADSYTSTLELAVPVQNAWTEFTWDGNEIIDGTDDRPITIHNLYPGSDDDMNLDNGFSTTYFTGGATSYDFPIPPVADFTADTTSGVVPLTVQFTDQSDYPSSWVWDFGDGDTSTAQNPAHTYENAGTYTVSLTATNAHGSDTETKTDYITVTEAPLPVTDTLLNAIKPSSLQSGGYLQVRVGGQWSSVTIDGTVYDVDVGDTVRLTIGSDGTGSIWADSGGLSTFSFDDVTLKVNGAVVDSGTVTGIWINDADSYTSTLELAVPVQNAWTEFTWDGNEIIDGTDDRPITIHNLYPGSDDDMNLYNGFSTTYFTGGATSYDFPIPPVADFTADTTSGVVPLTVQFTDQSDYPSSWVWDFGDGDTSTAQNPAHTYENAGTYTVSLTATNAHGSDTETKTDYITVAESGPTEIFFDDFEDGNYHGWTRTYNSVDMTTSPAIGDYSVMFRDLGDMERTISTAGYSGITVSFWMGADKLVPGESMRAYWSDNGGASWTLLKRINKKDPEEDGALHFFSYELPSSADNNVNFKLRFVISGSNNQGYGFVDDVRVEGYG